MFRKKRKAAEVADTRIKAVHIVERKRSTKPRLDLYATLQDTDKGLNWTNFGQVKIKPSTIPDAGEGLFATEDFKTGDVVTEYVGQYFHNGDDIYISCALKNTNYVFAMNYEWNLDGDPSLRGELTSKQLGSKANSVLPDDQGHENCYCRIIICGNENDPTSATMGINTNPFAPTSVGQKHKTKVAKERRFLICKKDVKKGTELLWFYGADYWKVHEI